MQKRQFFFLVEKLVTESCFIFRDRIKGQRQLFLCIFLFQIHYLYLYDEWTLSLRNFKERKGKNREKTRINDILCAKLNTRPNEKHVINFMLDNVSFYFILFFCICYCFCCLFALLFSKYEIEMNKWNECWRENHSMNRNWRHV